MQQRSTPQRAVSYCWILFLLLITGCDAWDLMRQETGLIAYYPFTGNFLDGSGNKLNGIPMNGATYGVDRNGVSGSALLLDGVDDYVEVPDDTKLRPDALSVSVWIKPKTVTETAHIYTKSNWVKNENQQYDAYIRPHVPLTTDCCDIQANVNQDGVCNTEQNISRAVYYDPAYGIDRWYHIVTVFVGQTGKVYVNGDLKVAQTQRLPDPIEKCIGGNLRFGASYDGDVNYFNGSLDDIRLYNRALTDAEVKALYKL